MKQKIIDDNYHTLIDAVEKRNTVLALPEDKCIHSLFAMNDRTFKSCLHFCAQRKWLITHAYMSFLKRPRYSALFNYNLPLEHYISRWISQEKIREITDSMRKRISEICPEEREYASYDYESVFFEPCCITSKLWINQCNDDDDIDTVDTPPSPSPSSSSSSHHSSIREIDGKYQNVDENRIFEFFPYTGLDWKEMSKIPRLASYENVFVRHPYAPWDWEALSRQRHLATPENVFDKHPDAPWCWYTLTLEADTIGTVQNVFERYPEKPWDMFSFMILRKDVATRKNIFHAYPALSHLWNLPMLLSFKNILFDADDHRELRRKTRAVRVIENAFWKCMVDPAYTICRKRLLREFEELSTTTA